MAYKNRWYDQDPEASKAVNMLLVFPPEIQSILGEGMSLLAEKQFKADEFLNDIKSLGTEKVMALYKSAQKKRDYDSQPGVHKMMNYLTFMVPENRTFMLAKTHEVAGFIVEYLQECQKYRQEPALCDVQTMTHEFVEKGSWEAQEYLKTFRTNLIQTIQNKPVETPQKSTSIINSNGDDMRISSL